MAAATKDYHEVPAVARAATVEQIKAAYRKLACKFHPDLNPGERVAQERFKELRGAYNVLFDAEKRRLYDQYGDDRHAVQEGGGVPSPGREGSRAGGGPQAGCCFDGFDFGGFRLEAGGMGDIFEEIFARAGGARTKSRAASRGSAPAPRRAGRKELRVNASGFVPLADQFKLL